MATRGVFQCQKIALHYCPKSGSSRGIREAIANLLIPFASKHPEATYETVLRRGKHPFLMAEYITGHPQQVGVKNKSAEEVMAHVAQLRSRSGRKIKRLARPVLSDRPSVQGEWTPSLQIFKQEFQMQEKN
mmetsp:Transcript_28753/g.42635  ORF Transcript_28753/g.42635 Transcript_28753/m.42635 type:complete len:131 (+) Transcript_28753:51-443(+)